MDFEKYASEAVALYKEAGVLDDLRPSYYHDKSFKQKFVPTMSQDDINSELAYIRSNEGAEELKRYDSANLKVMPVATGLGAALGTYIGTRSSGFSPKARLHLVAGGAIAGAVGGGLGTYLSNKAFGGFGGNRARLLNLAREHDEE